MSKRCLGCMELFSNDFNVCPHCGYIVGTHAEEAIHMEPGTLLYDRYIVGRVLGFGGFGVTYIGWDGKLEQKVAIKEYLPGEFSTRMPGRSQVTVFNGNKSEQFRDGLKNFVEEAKRLAKFQNEPGIVKVFDSFEENDTAYIIMEYLDGETLTQYLKREKKIPEDRAIEMLMPLMRSLQTVHDEGILHRDIAPDNIFITKTGDVKLIDFGASRYATTSHSRSLTVIIKPGFSPEEQYRSRGDQGPYTDVYAVAATLYKMVTGKTPPDAMERRAKYENQNKDILEEPHKINKSISLNTENAILNAINVRIEDRTPNIATFINELNATVPVKRKYGKIKRIDIYSWPLWLKASLGGAFLAIILFATLLATNVINFTSLFTDEIIIPEGVMIVPDVEGLYKEEALALITQNKLLATTGGNIESEYVEPGKILLQTPVGGSYLETNGTVSLVVSAGKGVEQVVDGIATIPYVLWSTKEEAISKLLAAGLAEPIIEEIYDENISAGQVVSLSKEFGEKVPEGTVLTMTVSVGAKSFDMPNVVGKTELEAKSILEEKGIMVTVGYKNDDTVPENSVISQSIKAGDEVIRGDKVTITVSSGKSTIEVENVVGKSRDNARAILKSQGFNVVILENYDNTVSAGLVISQTPQGGTYQIHGATVTVYVSKGMQPINVTFNANGGYASVSSIVINESNISQSLPTPTRDYYSFLGWYDSANGGTAIYSYRQLMGSGSQMLYAKWSKNQASGWVESLPANVSQNKSAYLIEEKTQYRYKEKKTTTSDSNSMSGWTLYNTEQKEGNWSDWSTTKPSEKSSRTIESKTQYVYYHYVLTRSDGYVGAFPINKDFYNNTELPGQNGGATMVSEKYHEYVSDTKLNSPTSGYSSVTYYNFVTKERITENTYENAHCSCPRNNYLFFSGQQTAYRYKDMKYTYHFYKWGDWSSWSDNYVANSDSIMVETKKMYQYTPK